jgi:cytoskeleton protein RodZ
MDNEIAAIHETSKMTNQSEKSKLTGLGARLRKTRESMHLTQKEAAARLYLNPKIVEVIENEAFFDGPPMTFMRGYLRSYARLLNFPESEIRSAIDELELNTTPTSLATPRLQAGPIYRGDRYIRWITYLIVLTLISLVVLWWSSHSKYVITDVPSTNPSVNQVPTVTTTTTTAIKTPETAPIVTTESPNNTTMTPATEPKTEVQTTTAPVTTAPPTATVTTAPTAPATPPATVVTPTTQPPAAPNSAIPATATSAAIPSGENPANTMLNTAAPTEKPAATKHQKKYKRHQYRPIENMDIPEPD